MAEWADFGNYENLAALICRPPYLPIEGLRQAINERVEYVRGNEDETLPDIEINQPWMNQNLYPDSVIEPNLPTGDAIQAIRKRVKEYCVNFVAYPTVNFSFEGYNIADFPNVGDPPNYNWTYETLLAYVKTKYAYFGNKYPDEDQEPHQKSTADWVQLLYYMINEMRAIHVYESFSPVLEQFGYAHSTWKKAQTSKDTDWSVVKNELLNSAWYVGTGGSGSYHLTSWKNLSNQYWVQDCTIMRVAFLRLPSDGAVVDTYVQPSRQDFVWRQIPEQSYTFPTPIGFELYAMRTDVKVESNNKVFDPILKEGFEVWVEKAPIPTPSFPDNPWQVGNESFWGADDSGFINIATLFFNFRNYSSKL